MVEALMRRCDELEEDSLPEDTLQSGEEIVERPTRLRAVFGEMVAIPCGWLRRRRERLRSLLLLLYVT
jgi:hypothetical protein